MGKDFEYNGFMMEAVRAMCHWALKQSGVSRIVAETDVDGFASQRVLRRCGLQKKDKAK